MQEHVALLLEDAQLTLDELAVSCAVSREWIIEHVQAGVLPARPGADPARWLFSGGDLRRTLRLTGIERGFDANPELAGLVADLLDELDRLRVRMRRAGLSLD
ncbi:chaperone modulator CbpM [Noviherbaspirillum sp. UKPF54]|uniref:chaperone modulator CbpM n=1 Tax=Noviherbaspirillum sp. UKPF54 TaxID=2601898 RepID=UPI0011B10450|nr:chaperone modulator CbpM [Noviherbaspirillum sp. UKPF54]QDZ26710.1 MerR family transcriptional regulator [Noviherbaspirillum sp. UKPF54]